MSIINAEDLEASPLADLHALASTLGIDGFRRLRKPELVENILARQGGEVPAAPASDGPAASGDGAPSRSGRPSRRRRGRARDGDSGGDGNGNGSSGSESSAPQAEAPPRNVEGVVELLPNGSGFVRPDGAKNSDGDVYISAAQARRCELVAGDRVSGPVRPPRRSERHPSMIRIDTINGVAADEVVNGTRIDDIEVDWPTALLALGSGDAVLTSIAQAAPFGRGSRVVISGPPRSGKSMVLGRLAAALAPIEGLELEIVAVGVRPEELTEYKALEYCTAPGQSFVASHEALDAAVEQAVERGRRVAVRGGDAVLLIDTLNGLSAGASRRALAAARNLRGAGSLTVIATAREPLGGETTVIALDAGGASVGIDKSQSGTLRAELLVAEKPKRAAPAKPRAPRKRAPAKPAASKADSAK
jgi:transcription termination factor Rho